MGYAVVDDVLKQAMRYSAIWLTGINHLGLIKC